MITAPSTALTRRVAQFVSDTDVSDIPAPLFEHAKVAFMDWLAVTLAGRHEPLVEILLRLARHLGGKEQATVLGFGTKTSVAQAALINGSASHALDYDDSLEAFLGHPSVTLFPGLLAMAEHRQTAGREFLAAYILGLQAGAAIGSSAGMKHYMNGWHATSTIGHLASAAANARLLGLDATATAHALGIAGTQAGGLKRVFGTMCKPFHAGRASEAGVIAALLAADAFTSAEDILEGPFGFFQVLNGEGNIAPIDALGSRWAIENLAQKYHASCHATHSAIEAVLAIRDDHALVPGDVAGIEILVSQLAVDAAGQLQPTTGLAGKFSIPYCVANALLRGDTGVQAFTDERVNAPDVQAFMRTVSVAISPEFKTLEATASVRTTGGAAYAATANILKDIPPFDAKRSKIEAKFTDLCAAELGVAKAEALLQAIRRMDTLRDMGDIVALASG